ncbi:MAG: metallophosphoesterase [Desulfobacterales bacterium]|nr:MAG: metallophosphoesterase [Desulfobacterales bacterium]
MKGRPYWIAIGDLHDDVSGIGRVPGISEAQGVLISGDITNYGSRARVERLLGEIEHFNVNIFAQIGNMDTRDVEDYLEQRGFNVHARATDLGFRIGLVGVGYSTPTPFGTPSEVSDAQIQAWLDRAIEQARDFEHLILMAHNAPFGTKTDRVGFGQSVGSRAVRGFIEKHQPDVCITGHIHESKGVDWVGKTQIINSGLFGAGGYVLIRLVEGTLQAQLRQI